MASGQKSSRWSLFRWGNQSEEHVVDQYTVGRVRQAVAVRVARDAAVVGDIVAPQVVIEGVVYGSIIAREVRLAATAVVWGDVYSTAVQIAPQGQLNGWLGSIDEARYNELYEKSDSRTPAVNPAPAPATRGLPPELDKALQNMLETLPPERTHLLRHFQRQAATAALARLELEQKFEERLHQNSLGTSLDATRIRERTNMLETEKEQLSQLLSETQSKLERRARDLADQQETIHTAEQTIERQSEAMDELLVLHNAQAQELMAAQKKITQLQQEIQELHNQAELTAERIRSLDIALQDSLQRGADQEEALVRWQELAELTEKQAKEAKAELDTLVMQQREGSQSLAIMRDQRNRLEDEWDKAQDEISQLKKQLQGREPDPQTAVELAQTKKELERRMGELNLTKQAMVESTGALAQAKRQLEMAEQELNKAREQTAAFELAQEKIRKQKEELAHIHQELNKIQAEHRMLKVDSERRITALQQDNQRARDRLQELQAQVVAHETALKTADTKLQQAALRDKQQEKLVGQLHQQVQTAKQAVAQAQASAGEMEPLRAQLATLQADYESQQSKIKQMKQEASDGRSRLQALEHEVDTYQEQITQQGRRTAELQMELVEHDMRYKQVLAGARKQAAELQQIKQAAQQRIAALQADLQKARQQVQDLTGVLERYRKK
jgi:chromosome segregation ATPase